MSKLDHDTLAAAGVKNITRISDNYRTLTADTFDKMPPEEARQLLGVMLGFGSTIGSALHDLVVDEAIATTAAERGLDPKAFSEGVHALASGISGGLLSMAVELERVGFSPEAIASFMHPVAHGLAGKNREAIPEAKVAGNVVSFPGKTVH